MNKIEITSSDTKIDAGLFKVVEQTVKGDFGTKTRHLVDREPVVYIFPLTPEYDVYLTSQYRYNHGKHIIDGVAGYVDPGEDPLVAAKRELKEEAVITADELGKIGEFEIGAGVLKGKVHTYFAKGLSHGDTEFDEEEDIELLKMPLSEAVNKVISGEINITACCLGLLLLDKLKQEGKV